ncbi:MAG: glycosyltransferase, partial [Chloroflexaceae bacterium]|nr:glycosyltransferase [Chloroflexaceae bacterium]
LPLAVDMYDPLILEGLDLYASAPLRVAEAQHARYQALTEALLARGDFFFCATAAQRDYWLGALSAAGRITPALARSTDRELHQLIDLVPSGLPATPPAAGRSVLRGVHPAIPTDSLICLWAGGLWDWFDPQLIVRAVAVLRDTFPQLRLCFFAGARPNPHGAPFRTAVYEATHALAAELGLLNQHVIFLEAWVPYAERGAYLAEADLGVSAHRPGIETHFAFRTRLLDYLWARLPVVCTAGDSLGSEIVAAGAGLAVPPHDLDGWVAALGRMASDSGLRQACRAAAEPLVQRYRWDSVAQPLAAFCAAPRRTAAPLPAPAVQRIAELEAALDERLRYLNHVESHYQALVKQRESGWLARLRRMVKGG